MFRYLSRGHLRADELVVVGVAGEIGAVAIRDGQRGSRRGALLSEIVGEPIEAESRDDDAAHPAVVAVERQRKLNDLTAGSTDPTENSPTVNAPVFRMLGEVGPRTRWKSVLMVAVGVAERADLRGR